MNQADRVEREALLDEIAGSADWLRLVWESAPDAMVLSDPDGIVLMANPAYCDLYGYAPDEVVGHSFAIIFPPELRDGAVASYREVVAGDGAASVHETWIRRKDGSERFVQARAEILVHAGRRRALLSIIRDVTERMRAEEALREREGDPETLLALAPVMVFTQDIDLRYTWALTSIPAGPNSEDIVGKTDAELLPPDEAAALTAMKRRVLEEGERVHGEIGLTIGGARMDVTYIAAPVRDGKGTITGLIAAAVDVSAHRTLERQQRQFVAMAAHELRTPVTSIFGYAQLLQRRDPSNRAVDTIVKQAASLDRLINDLVDVSRLETGRLDLRRERVDLVALVRDVVEHARPLSEGRPIRLEAPEPPVEGHWDPDRLGQVIQNLLSNAIKYSPGGGEVVISVADLGRDALLAVRDAGVGIAPALLPRLFEPFYRVERTAGATRGLGLGLHITKSLVESHGGQIRAESAGEGRGSTFTVVLPRWPDAPGAD